MAAFMSDCPYPDLAPPPSLVIAVLGQASIQEDRQCACVRQVRIELLIQFGSDLIINVFPVDCFYNNLTFDLLHVSVGYGSLQLAPYLLDQVFCDVMIINVKSNYAFMISLTP